ncbi:MAG: nuclear transport factor 2 family protein, partial [Acidobacteria bacterium]|nr:nuclear transport factor 2 family protein [Acidobacteriota bacterium]
MHTRTNMTAMAIVLLLVCPMHAQQSHWASSDDKAAQYITGMEQKWAEGVCVDNGVVADLLTDDFTGTSTKGKRFTKADELNDEKSARSARDCGLDEARIHFFGD